MRSLAIVLGALLIAAGITAAGWMAGNAFVESRLGPRIVTVKGLSERDVKADLAFWPIKYQTTGATLEEARAALDTASTAVNDFLTGQGFMAGDFSIQSLQVEDRFAENYGSLPPGEARYVLTQTTMLRTENVDAVAAAAQNLGDLVRAGVLLSGADYETGPFYQFTGLNALKPDMLTEAAMRAREAAEQFAQDTNAEVGAIKSANQGVFEITAAVSIPNQNDDKQVEKKVRVVSTVTYFLND